MTSPDPAAKSELKQYLLQILDIARWAPSVHNTQPWLVSLSPDDTLTLRLDHKHALKPGDPTGRQSIISLGIFTEAITLAAKHYGFLPTAVGYSGQEVSVRLKTAPPDEAPWTELLRQRCSDRSIYTPIDLSDKQLDALKTLPTEQGIKIHVITERDSIKKIADLTAKGIALALSSPAFRNELGNYLLPLGSHKKRGIAVQSLYLPWFISLIEPLLVHSPHRLAPESRLEKRRWLSASAVIIITAPGDMEPHWFAAGRCYLRASLAIERAGLAQATSAAIVEASNYHDDVEELLGTNDRILAILRVGKGSKTRHYSPRLDSTDLITSPR